MKRRSITKNITIGSVALIIVTFCIALGTNYWIAVVQSEKAYKELMAQQLIQLTKSLENPLWSFDEKTIQLIGDAYMANVDVVSLKIFLENIDAPIYTHEKATSANIIYGQKDVYCQNERIGHLRIGITRASFSDSNFRLLTYSLFVASFMIFSMYFVMKILFKKYLSKPLMALEDWTDRVARGDYGRAPHEIPEQELTSVVHKFSEMSEQIRRRETLLQQSEQKFRDLTELLPQVVFETDADINITYTNRHGFELFGYTQADLDKGFGLARLASPEDRTRIMESAKTRMAGGDDSVSNEYKMIRKDGFAIPVLIYWSPIKQDGNTLGLRGVLVNISERKKLETQLRQVQKMEAIGTLAGGIAHDFNNILSAVIGYAELALDNVEKGSILEDYLQEIFTAGNRAKDLVKQILTFARQVDEEIKPVKVITVAKEALKLLRASIPASIEIRQHLESDSLIMGDPTQIHQIFMNLCTNAAHAMEERGGEMEIGLVDVELDDSSPLTLNGLKAGSYMKINVSDTGPGISPDIIDSIFEPYFSTKDVGEGTGMGLAMVHGIVESYGGKITAESEFGKGTTLLIYLPITKRRDFKRSFEEEKLPSGNERILLVDDELPIVKIGSRILETLGYHVTVRTSSVEALELFRSRPNDFDLVITDMTMPNMKGDKLADELMGIRPDIPVILCTGYSKNISDESAADIGIKAFAYKPIVKADLAKTVRKVFDAGRREAYIYPSIESPPETRDEAKNFFRDH